ncbi:hypothetical protein BU23DRAFT_564515 [Bimuria novae-zelandiae CBS 107.79]|uniref:Uncharacterized protein n=1 Tax=Bimuria novae-zelandiae CBS 107.79 TaxID=1447943 RepID=A0A6A5VNI5_9PLEO|nr:hypothetical protein BU23DRAFT_564515 [Bimuria novae-zelandiae CBS 107.79]
MELANKVAGGAAALLLCRELETGPSSGHHEETLAKMGERVVSRAGAPHTRVPGSRGAAIRPLGESPDENAMAMAMGYPCEGKESAWCFETWGSSATTLAEVGNPESTCARAVRRL